MDLHVTMDNGGHRLAGDGVDVTLVNQFLEHLSTRNFAAAIRRAYAYDLLCFERFCAERRLSVTALSAPDVFDWLEWQGRPVRDVAARRAATVVGLQEISGAAPASMNRRVAALRGLCEYAVLAGVRPDNPVPAARRSSGARVRRGLLGASWAGSTERCRAVGPRRTPVARVPRCGGGCRLRRRLGDGPGPGDGAGDAARWPACR